MEETCFPTSESRLDVLENPRISLLSYAQQANITTSVKQGPPKAFLAVRRTMLLSPGIHGICK
jgi:hypothetical protein